MAGTPKEAGSDGAVVAEPSLAETSRPAGLCRCADVLHDPPVLSTFQALLVAVFAILPGALYTWAFEREAGAWGVGLGDRLLRFFGASAVFSILTLPLLYEGYRRYVVTGALREGVALPAWLWLSPGALLLPVVAGWVVGWATRHGKRWVRPLVGRAPAPRGWDQLFRTPRLGVAAHEVGDGAAAGAGMWDGSPAAGCEALTHTS